MKSCCHIWYQDCQNGQNAKNYARIKILTFGTKKSLIWVFLACSFQKLLLHLESTLPKLSKCEVLYKNKNPWIWNQNALFEYFWVKFWKIMVSFHVDTFKLVKRQNFVQKIKIFKFGSKNALFWNFGVVVFKSYCHIWIDYSRVYQSELLTNTANFEIGFAFS